MPITHEKKNVELVGHNDLQGRGSLQVTARGDWVYVGHHNGRALNPMTGVDEWNGTSILDVRDPSRPELVAHIPNAEDANARAVQVVYGFGPRSRDYLIRNHETSAVWSFEVFDVTDRRRPVKVSEITHGPRGGALGFAHKGWWSNETGYYYCAAREKGVGGGAYLMIFDVKDPEHPRPVAEFMLPGQEDPTSTLVWHHPIVDEERHRVYGAYLHGGDVVAVDTTDIRHPALVWRIAFDPPYRGTHTVAPVVYEKVPNFGAGALPRTYALVSDEATDIQCENPIRAKVYMLDVTNAEETGVPFPVETWQVPDGDFCARGARFGPHQYAETVDGRINRFHDKIAYFAYFNGGLRVVDISDPYDLREVGHYLPPPGERSFPLAPGQPLAIQFNDVDIDHRGLVHATDRVGAGLFVLKYTPR